MSRWTRRFRPDKRAFLLKMLPTESVGAEIGVWQGDFSAMLLREVRPRLLHLVDPWTFIDDSDHAGSWYGGGRAKTQADMDSIAAGVASRFASESAGGRIVIQRLPSVHAAAEIDDASLDWVYIDGDHLYGAVAADIEAWWPKVKPTGLLCGDDYGPGGWWEGGVARAVDEFVERERGASLLTVRNTQFIIRRE